MVQVYERYKQSQILGLITSTQLKTHPENQNKILSLALTQLLQWDIKQGTKSLLNTLPTQTTCISTSNTTNSIAIGCIDGSIHILDSNYVIVTTFNGHRQSISTLAFNSTGTKLISGSADNDIIVWDLVAEVGLARLKGHTNKVTALAFINDSYIISASKDSFVKVWDLIMSACVENISIHSAEVWDLSFCLSDLKLYTASLDLVRIFSLDFSALLNKSTPTPTSNSNESTGTINGMKNVTGNGIRIENNIVTEIKKAFTLIGSLNRQSKEVVKGLKIHCFEESKYLTLSTDKSLEVYSIKNKAELMKAEAKKRKKAVKAGIDYKELEIDEMIVMIGVQRLQAKIKSYDLSSISQSTMKIVVGLGNNSIELYSLDLKARVLRLASQIGLPGHRSDVRTLALSSDDSMILSGSAEMVKVWSRASGECLNSFESGYVLSSTFLPGNTHLVIGTKAGMLEVYEIGASCLVEVIEAHSGPIWSICLLPDKTGLVTGSQDKEVKFWKFGTESSLFDNSSTSISSGRKADGVRLIHSRTLKLSDDVLCVKVSPDSKMLAVALLDMTVKVFFMDTLKFSISLYGHKLPVITLDISSDSKLIITGSSDKSIKVWGLDFGDCHKSFLGHTDSVMQVQFIHGTKSFFSVSKDRRIKFWDAGKFVEVAAIDGHCGEIWALCVGRFGDFFVTAAHDQSIRVWERSEEEFVVEEEREARLEEMYENLDIDQARADEGLNEGTGVFKTTGDSLKAGEVIAEALRVWELERNDLRKYELIVKGNPDASAPPRNAAVIQDGFAHLPPDEYVYQVISKIRSSHLNDALLTLPFSLVILLLDCLSNWVEKRLDPVLYTRVMKFVIKSHRYEVIATAALKPILQRIQLHARVGVREDRDLVGFNRAALEFLKREKDLKAVTYFGDESVDVGGGIKRKRITVVS